MTTIVVKTDGELLTTGVNNLTLENQNASGSHCENHGDCAICMDKILLQETALVKGCEHAYCVTCILQWATYSQKPTCPQCKQPFESLNIHRSLDGSINDFMFEESVCLLLRATWFKPLAVEETQKTPYDDPEDFYLYEDDENEIDDGLDEAYYNGLSLRIGNRRWGDNGYVRAGRQEARPVYRPNLQNSGAGSSREPRKKEPADETVGRRAKRSMKREAANKEAAAKHQRRLARLGRK